jgi:hypothetical protein
MFDLVGRYWSFFFGGGVNFWGEAWGKRNMSHSRTQLVVEPDVFQATIKKAYRKLVLKWPPDKHPENRASAINLSGSTPG